MKLAIILLLKNAARMLIGRKVVMWGLRLAVAQTDNKIDDNIVALAEACYDNDSEKLMRAGEGLVAAIKNR